MVNRTLKDIKLAQADGYGVIEITHGDSPFGYEQTVKLQTESLEMIAESMEYDNAIKDYVWHGLLELGRPSSSNTLIRFHQHGYDMKVLYPQPYNVSKCMVAAIYVQHHQDKTVEEIELSFVAPNNNPKYSTHSFTFKVYMTYKEARMLGRWALSYNDHSGMWVGDWIAGQVSVDDYGLVVVQADGGNEAKIARVDLELLGTLSGDTLVDSIEKVIETKEPVKISTAAECEVSSVSYRYVNGQIDWEGWRDFNTFQAVLRDEDREAVYEHGHNILMSYQMENSPRVSITFAPYGEWSGRTVERIFYECTRSYDNLMSKLTQWMVSASSCYADEQHTVNIRFDSIPHRGWGTQTEFDRRNDTDGVYAPPTWHVYVTNSKGRILTGTQVVVSPYWVAAERKFSY